ncbi:ABC-type branched-subunit amino acid transport system substrate-binding protein [Aeromicrobium panaciterrae]|uniref:ABC-type branched-subunit amino acid transport system substrate-binding protein n=1 Tax=Aeromicrobium panaciterrae TaxID=363861 RepID=A0ABU1UMB8_9ACTN|nr:ABC transporter substrate-binding protein [Aeromicrobium panaciterrae]MDR7086321.1 ABC-type branched-subunit amino acid transport system substrate-binding protein [Aeromicrobium panaciterrae]
MNITTRRGRIAALTIGVSLALTLTGCAGSSDSDGNETANVDLGAVNKATGSPVKVGFIGDAEAGSGALGNGIGAAQASADYANEYLGGLGGNKIELVTCSTEATPATATACAVKLAKEGVVAVTTGVTGQDHAIFEALEGTGVPFIVSLTADEAIMSSKTGFVFQNPLAIASASAALIKKAGAKTGGFIVVDAPAATGPVEALTKPLFAAQGIGFEMVPLSLQVADPTSAIQQSINNGSDAFTILGDNAFVTRAIKSLNQLGFDGPMITNISAFQQDQIDSMPNGLKGVTTMSSITRIPEREGLSEFGTIMDKFGDDIDTGADSGQVAYQTFLGFVESVNLTPGAGTSAKDVVAALKHMPKAVPLRLAPGLTLNCDGKAVAVLQGVCNSKTIAATLNAKGFATTEALL